MESGNRTILLLVAFLFIFNNYFEVKAENITKDNGTEKYTKVPTIEEMVNQTKMFEKGLKKVFKSGVKLILPSLMSFNKGSAMSDGCIKSFTKFLGALTNVKVWAVQMLDSTSKIPSGIFEGTLSEFGAFDQCLDISVPKRDGKIEFRGKYCAMEIGPHLPPIPKNFSLARRHFVKPHDTIGALIWKTGAAFQYLKFRFGVCLPSACTVEDVRMIAATVSKLINMDIKVPQCYIKEDVTFKPVHISVVCILTCLVALTVAGTVLDLRKKRMDFARKNNSVIENILTAFSLPSNYGRLISPSKNSNEMKALHGLRALSMAWVILGHTYVWINFQLLRRPSTVQIWFNNLEIEAILNGWLSVEPFFFLSGLLTTYAVIQILGKTSGKINVPIFIVRRYVRLTPPLLLVMGLLFFLPVLSSGPFWYERIDPEINACRTNWWTSLLHISNWWSVNNICIHPTWYLSADFQLHILSLLVLVPLYRSSTLGLSVMGLLTLAGNTAVGVLTYLWELPPTIQISSGNDKQIIDTVNVVHIRTFTHIGPYCVGMATGYLILKNKGIRLTKLANLSGWCISIAISLAAVYGVHRWNIGYPHGPVLTFLYASLHRTVFTIGVAWVAFACVTGHGGLINKFLSSSFFAPLSRLTFMVYLLHSLVIWTRMASLRDRMFYSHYNLLYEYVGNVVFVVFLAVPFYLLVEAPVANLDRLLFSKIRVPGETTREAKELFVRNLSNFYIPSAVELKSINTVYSEHTSKDTAEYLKPNINGHFVQQQNKC